MRKSRVDSKIGTRDNSRNKDYRFFLIAGAFLVVCIVFCVFFVINQFRGPSGNYENDGLTVRIETVAGERGRIYDRNGKLLVGNATDYDLIFEYGSMPDRRRDVNASLLECLSALSQTGNMHKRVADFFALEGSYPELEFSPKLTDNTSREYYYYERFLEKNRLSADISAGELVDYLVKKYELTKYSDSAKTELMRIYYDMERIDFGYYQSYTLAEGFETTVESDMALISYISEHRTEGATLIRSSDRVYYYEGYATHVLGSMGKITAENVELYADYPLDAMVGISGCENVFESYLRGFDGKRISKYNDAGELVEQYYDPAPVVGNDIYLTLDIELQIAAEDALRDAVESLKESETGALSAIDPNTGEALVIASHSTESSMNFALQGAFAPGSTYKVGSVLAALEEGYISENTSHYCDKVYPYLGGPTCLGNHGDTDAHKAIEVSCNIFFYYLGHGWGLDNITDYTARLGLGVPTGIELGERVGIVASKAYCEEHGLEWGEFDDATGAIGQSKHAYTPLQLSVYMSSLANGGTRYSAHILKCVKTKQGEIVFESGTEALDKIDISDKNHGIIMNAMRSVVSSSSTLSNYFSGVGELVSGKTGTAETGKAVSNALFSGFAPFDDPQIVVSCVLEEGGVGTNAAAVTAKVFEAYFAEDTEKVEE